MSGEYLPIGAVSVSGEEDDGGAHVWHFTAEDGARAEVALLAEDLARVRLVPSGREPAPSWAVAREEWPAIDVRAERQDGVLALTTPAMRVQLDLDPFRVSFQWPDGASFAADDPQLGMGSVPRIGPKDLPSVDFPTGSLHCTKRLEPGARIFGCGERTSPLDKRGEHLVFYNVDPPQPHGADTRAMYVSIPFWLTLRDDGRCYGIFLDSVWKSALDAGANRPDALAFGVAGGDLTYYVFAGPTPVAVLARYADLTGHMPLPPRWALGYGQCRWSYYPEDEVRYIAEEYRRRKIPCDSVWLDIDYMDGYRDFTWNPWRFPDPAKLARELGAEGFKLVTIIDPGVKADPTDETYRQGLANDYFVRRPDGRLFIGHVWPGESAFPDFSRAEVRAWWGERHRTLLDAGVAGIWDDMNEPALTDRFVPGADVPHGTTMPPDVLHRPDGPDGPSVAHAAFHNAFGMQMARATFEGQQRLRPDRRPFVLSRSGYAGIQRYAAVWTGDNRSLWEHMRLAARMCLSLGLSGLPFVGFDTGGFWLDASGEMLVRFTQLGAAFPFFRNHSAHRTEHQEPWQRGQPYEALIRAAIELRYRLLPYIYTAFAEAGRTGAPITRPLVYAYPSDPALATIEDAFLLGPDLLIAPILEEDQFRRAVQLPPGAWQDWLTGQRFVGPRRLEVDAPLDVLPIFVREGAIVPLGPVMQWVGQLAEEPLTLKVYLPPNPHPTSPPAHLPPHPLPLSFPGKGPLAEGMMYEDDGESPAYQRGVWRRTRYTAELAERLDAGGQVGTQPAAPAGVPAQPAGEWTITLRAQVEGQYEPGPREHTVELHLPHRDPAHPPAISVTSVRLNGNTVASNATAQRRRYDTLVRVPLGRVSGAFTLDVQLRQ
jgi:alpha-glucosidase